MLLNAAVQPAQQGTNAFCQTIYHNISLIMVQSTAGIVLRSIKYGETSVVVTIFTSLFGIQAYMVKGVRSTKTARNRSGLLQPASLLDMVVYHQSQKTLQHIREFQPAPIYHTVQQDVIKNSVALFSVELLLRLLPENAPLPDLFDFSREYFIRLDEMPRNQVANFPLFFMITCSRQLGYELKGDFTRETPHLNLQEGGYTDHPPAAPPYTSPGDAAALHRLLQTDSFSALPVTIMTADMRMRLTEWYVAFLQIHSQHMGNIRSLAVLRTILH